MHVPYLDLHAQYLSLRDDLHSAIDGIFERSAFILGPGVADLERDFAMFCGTKHAIGVNNGTAAIHLALLACGIGPGDEVITQANTFIATVAGILHAGATPVLVDVAPPTYGIDVDAVAAAITPRTRAIVPVHLFGHPANLSALRDVAQKHGLILIEDASQAHGATYHGTMIGSRGHATFSFYPGKNLGAAGEGGALVTSDDVVSEKARLYRNHGSVKKYQHDVVGYNYRMEGIQGAVLGVKLKHLAEWTAARRRVAAAYDSRLTEVLRPQLLARTESAYHIYPVLVESRDRIAEILKQHSIETNVHYPIPCHLQPGYVFLGYGKGAFPNSEFVAERELSLPIFPELRDVQIDYVSECLINALRA